MPLVIFIHLENTDICSLYPNNSTPLHTILFPLYSVYSSPFRSVPFCSVPSKSV